MPEAGPGPTPDPVVAAEAWFLRHGLPYFVDDLRLQVHARLGRGRLIAVGGGALALGVLAGTALGLLASPSTGVAVALSVALGGLALYALRALRASVIAAWALRRAFGSLGLLLPLATRALPMLLLFITFLFINTEVWQVASALHGGVLWSAVLFFAAAAIGFLVPRMAQELDEFDDRVRADDLRAATVGTPLEAAAAELLADDAVDLPEQAQVTGLQMVNLVLVLTVAQVVQVFLLSVAVFGFFLVFGAVAIDASVVETWIGHAPSYPPGPHWISVELIRVATFLAGFSGLYFTVTAITDETYRREFFTQIMRELQRAVGTRVVYRALRDR